MLKPFLGNCAQITGKNPSSRFEGCPGTCCSFKIYITYIMYIVEYIYIILYILYIIYKCIYICFFNTL